MLKQVGLNRATLEFSLHTSILTDLHICIDAHLQDPFQTLSRHLPDTFQISSRHLPDTLWTPSRHPQDTPHNYPILIIPSASADASADMSADKYSEKGAILVFLGHVLTNEMPSIYLTQKTDDRESTYW